MENLVVLKRDDLEDLLRQVAANMKAEAKAEPARKLKMTLDEALIYLNEQGFPMSKSTMYKHTMSGTIPFSRFGERKILFDVNELDQWISKRLTGNDATGGDEITNTVAENARRKGRA